MDIKNLIEPILILAGMGLIFGLGLAFAGKKFHVDTDERLPLIIEALPGANCGGCGYAGCAGYATAILEGKAPTNLCAGGGAEAAEKIASIMGVDEEHVEPMVAYVACRGGINAKKRYEYRGISDCLAALRVSGGPNECTYGCLGFGTCVSVCPFGAIAVVDGVAKVDGAKCVGCRRCAEACPRGIISIIPVNADVRVGCSSHDRSVKLKDICSIGCFGCKRCENTCKHDAIHVEDNLARIDQKKCVGCGECVEVCPRHLIVNANQERFESQHAFANMLYSDEAQQRERVEGEPASMADVARELAGAVGKSAPEETQKSSKE